MRKRGAGINVGGSSILVIFVLLCLTTFATLSVVSANADYKLSQQTAAAADSYYRADSAAEELLHQVDGILARHAGAADENAYFSAAEAEMITLPDVAMIRMAPDRAVIQYQVELDETQALQIQLSAVYPPPAGDSRYAVEEWRVVSTAPLDPTEEGAINIWDGESPLFP